MKPKNKNQNKKPKKIVWKFTNKTELTAQEFMHYFEKKVKATIRKYQMPIQEIRQGNKKQDNKNNLNASVINSIIKNIHLRKGNLSSESLTDISNKILYAMMYQNSRNLKKLLPKNQPLYFLSDKEIQLYAELKKIKGKPKESRINKKLNEISKFIETIEQKNPDIRLNIVKALLRTKEKSKNSCVLPHTKVCGLFGILG